MNPTMSLLQKSIKSVTTTFTSFSSEQLLKTLLPMVDRLDGIVIEAKLLQPQKAKSPMEVTLSGMASDVSPVQP